MKTAHEHHAAIRANVDAYFANEIDHATFTQRASALHAAARADGPEVDDALRDLLVAALPGGGGR